MLAGIGKPFDSPRYLFEVKWDGIRALAFFGRGIARLQGRKLIDSTHRYPEIIRALEKLQGEGVMDGEIIVLQDGRPSFERVLVREQTNSLDKALVKAQKYPVIYVAFDLLYRDGEPLVDRPLTERKKALSELLKDAPSPIVENQYVLEKGKAFYDRVAEQVLEGVMAKAIESRYLVGERSNDWLKLKVRQTVDFIMVGTVREAGTGRVKSLVLGAYEDGSLIWMGNVGSGLDGRTLSQLASELGPLESEPPDNFKASAPGDIQWLEAKLVVRVEYLELTGEGRLRHPVFVGFVEKDPKECLAPKR